ncbi:MAG: hypothetical protein K2M23_02280, partial [Alphaproteobacteria bacterium]|nr:hypothetical protein [Alphaproteobacteria bacterium]
QNIALKDIQSFDKDVSNLVNQIVGHNIDLKEELRSIAYISSNFDKEIAGEVSNAVFENGVDGSYIIEEQYEKGLNYSQVVGYSFKSGYLHNAFVNTSNGSCIYDNPYILVKDNYCLADVIDYINTAVRDKNPLVIIGEPDEQVLQSFVKNHLEGVGSFCLISPTGFGKSRDNFLNDLKAVIGGDFGQCQKIVVKKHSTIIQHNTDLKDYVTILSNTDTLSKAEQDDNQKRIAALKGKVCVFKIGADSVAELRERKDRLEDSILSSISALKRGYVQGGGRYLYNLSFDVKNKKLKKVLQAPYKQILKNANLKGISSYTVNNEGETYHLIDSALVISTSLKNAWSVAKEILQTDYVIVEEGENAKR